MKMSCKPQTKYAAAITRNGTWVSDWSAARRRTETSAAVSSGAPATERGRPGRRPMRRAACRAPGRRSRGRRYASRRSTASIWPSGADNSAPSEPAAVTAPSTTLRTLAGTACDATASAMPDAVQASEVPIRNAGADAERRRSRLRVAEDDKARHIERRACHHERAIADAHRERAGDRLQEAPGEVLHRDRQREVRDRDGDVARQRLHEQPEALAQPHAERQHDRRRRAGCPDRAQGSAGPLIARLPAVLITQICVPKLRRPGIVSRKKVHRSV